MLNNVKITVYTCVIKVYALYLFYRNLTFKT